MARRRRSLKGLLSSVASTVGAWWGGGYSAVDPRRQLIDRIAAANRATANELLGSAGPSLRAYCRNLERNNPTARAAIEGGKALVVGSGIALEPKGAKADRIRDQWQRWIKHCGINGESLYELQTMGFGDIMVSGEIVWRYVVIPELADRGEIPLKILALESEWLADDVATVADNSITAVQGIDLDRYGRPVRYRLRNPYGGMAGEIEIVAAAEINHRFERRRALQNRGEPWFAPVIETLLNERDLVDTELYSAKMCAGPAFAIKTNNPGPLDTNTWGTTEDPASSIKIGSVVRLTAGEELQAFGHTRPSQQIAPFRQMLRGDTAAALRIPQRFLDRDVSRANYSSMKADQIDSERLLGPVRQWYGHATAGDAFAHVMPWMQLRAGITEKEIEYELIPDEIPYLDPEKDVAGALLAIAGGLTTWEREIGKRGEDAQKTLEQLKKELSDPLLAKIFNANLKVPPAPKAVAAPAQPAAEPTAEARSVVQPINIDVNVERDAAPVAAPEKRVAKKFRIKRGKDGLIDSVDEA